MDSINKKLPILEYDPSLSSIINPSDIVRKKKDIPEHCVITFFQDILEQLKAKGILREVFAFKSEMGRHPVYEAEFQKKRIAVFNPGIGAPLASALFEEIIALGCKYFIACGGAGVLDKSILQGHPVVPVSAVRDEGTSYHYLKSSREAVPSAEGIEKIKYVMDKHKIPYETGKTWTTDAVYRETKEKVSLRKNEGCLVVEMEAAALFAVAEFRKVIIAQILYGGDNLDGEMWEDRDWQKNESVREKLIWLAAEAVVLL